MLLRAWGSMCLQPLLVGAATLEGNQNCVEYEGVAKAQARQT